MNIRISMTQMMSDGTRFSIYQDVIKNCSFQNKTAQVNTFETKGRDIPVEFCALGSQH